MGWGGQVTHTPRSIWSWRHLKFPLRHACTHMRTHTRTCTPWAAWEQGAPQSDTQLPQRLTGDQQDKGTVASSSGRALGQIVGKGEH